MNFKRLKYRFIYRIVKLLGCEELLDYDEYNEVIPPKPRTNIGVNNTPSLLNNDIVMKGLMKNYNGRPVAFYDLLKETGFKRPANNTYHWEESKENKTPQP